MALVALLRALGLPPGSEALMPATLCANPAYAVRLAGLSPLFADVSPLTFNMDLSYAERVIGPNTRAVLVAPLFGHPLEVSSLLQFAERHALVVIEDAAHAVGLRYGDHPAGSVGLCSVYSFGPGKIAEAGGGAALLSDDVGLLERAHAALTTMPSGMLDMGRTAERISDALEFLPEELEKRRVLVQTYRQTLTLPGVTHPDVAPDLPLWKYSVLLPTRDRRDAVTRALLAHGVAATNLYTPLPRFFPQASPNSHQQYPVAWNIYNKIVNLPLWPQSPDLLDNVKQSFS